MLPDEMGSALESPTAPYLEWAFTLEVDFDLGLLHATMAGEKGFLRSGGGVVSGPRLSGSVAAQGGDWPVLRPDGIVESDARYMISAADGGQIYMRSRGCLRAEDLDAFRGGDTREPLHYRCVAQFDASIGPHQWLARSTFVGSGRLTRTGVRIDVFEVL